VTLGRLLCGASSDEGIAKSTLDHLSGSIDRFSGRALLYLEAGFSEDAQNFGAFCARVVLENACAALVGRFDPFRLIYLSEFQAHGSFEFSRASRSAFRWSGDVFTEDKPSGALWTGDHDPSKVSRALFSQYADHMFWTPAAEAAIDFIADNREASQFFEIQTVEPNAFLSRIKGKAAALYSTLSKGVHWEFFSSQIVLDEDTVKASIRECVAITGDLALVSHFVPTAYRSLPSEEAVSTYVELRSRVQ
jgi:hypothetical protein